MRRVEEGWSKESGVGGRKVEEGEGVEQGEWSGVRRVEGRKVGEWSKERVE